MVSAAIVKFELNVVNSRDNTFMTHAAAFRRQTLKKTFSVVCGIVFSVLLILVESTSAADSENKISFKVSADGTIYARAEFSAANALRQWIFPTRRLHAVDLAKRLENLRFYRGSIPVEFSAAASNVYETREDADGFSFVIKKRETATADAAFISRTDENGLQILLGDLLPNAWLEKDLPVRVSFEVPNDWRVLSSAEKISDNIFAVSKCSEAVFVAGSDWREIKSASRQNLRIAVKGARTLNDTQIRQTADSVAAAYQNLFGETSGAKMIFLAPYPQKVEPARWSAETLGANINILSGDSASETTAFNRLHEQLRHEFFHFYFPRGVRLKGAYDWFYEGFALYVALKIGVRGKVIRFEDFLQTLGRAFAIADFADRAAAVRNEPPQSLAKLSQKRFENASDETAYIYAKSLFVAFMCDLAIHLESRGARRLEDFLRRMFDEYGTKGKSADAEQAIREIFENSKAHDLLRKYAFEGSFITIEKEIDEAGFRFESGALQIVGKLRGRQKDLLKKLGYNPL